LDKAGEFLIPLGRSEDLLLRLFFNHPGAMTASLHPFNGH
jgi:hypothetical protein